MKDYTVHVVRDGKFWVIEVDGVAGGTQARNVAEIEVMARDFISLSDRIPEADVRLNTHIQLPEGVQTHLDRMTNLRQQELEARAEAARESRAAALGLKASGLTTREIGGLMGVSHQRAHQLISA